MISPKVKQMILINTAWCGNENNPPEIDDSLNVIYVKIRKVWWQVMKNCPKIYIEDFNEIFNPIDDNNNCNDDCIEYQRNFLADRLMAMILSKKLNTIKVEFM